MRRKRARLVGLPALVWPLIATAQDVLSKRAFASPEMAAAVSNGGAGGFGKITLALVVVLGALFLVAMVAKRFRNLSGGNRALEVIAQTPLSARERVVIVKVGSARLLLGVATGQVSLLHVLTDAEPVSSNPMPAPDARPTFSALLKRSLGR
jgi:flagellar protein FliO/FliZ